MLFLDSGDFKIEDIRKIYGDRKPIELPNIICFLDKGLIANFRGKVDEKKSISLETIDLFPEFNDNIEPNEWHFVNLGDNENTIGANFAFLYLSLIFHLKSCVLKDTNMLPYLLNIFPSNLGEKNYEKITRQ